jgi:hypothetical protein
VVRVEPGIAEDIIDELGLEKVPHGQRICGLPDRACSLA